MRPSLMSAVALIRPDGRNKASTTAIEPVFLVLPSLKVPRPPHRR